MKIGERQKIDKKYKRRERIFILIQNKISYNIGFRLIDWNFKRYLSTHKEV